MTNVRIKGVGKGRPELLAFVGEPGTRVRMRRVMIPADRWRCDECGEPLEPCPHVRAILDSADYRTLKTESLL